ncbi:MAG: hypothetical protein HN576_10715 [Bacteriovoracaceae bacterium]|nr:hypothetical protein [Bacteriovoracaceae bacterium]
MTSNQGLGRFFSLKKETKENIQKIYKRHIVFGNDLYSVDLYLYLLEKFGSDQVALFSRQKVTRESLKFEGPSLLRAKACKQYIQKIYPDVEFKEETKNPVFFKEGIFKEFGGRAKPEKLLWGEESFIEEKADFNEEDIFPFLKDQDLDKKLHENQFNYIPKEIVTLSPEDLIDPKNFEIKSTSGVHLSCEKLYMGTSTQSFLNLYTDKKELSDEFIELCEQSKTPASLYITFEFEKELTKNKETMFLPLSYTHEWGHFMGEFAPMREINGRMTQVARFLSFLDIDHTNEEGISKKIRLLKRQLEKIFKNFKTISYTESITLTESSMCLNFDDKDFAKIKKEFGNLIFVGASAPLESFDLPSDSFEYSSKDLFYLARGVASLVQIKNFLS